MPHASPGQPDCRWPAQGHARARRDLRARKRRPGPPQLAHVARAALWHFLRMHMAEPAPRDSGRPSGPLPSRSAGNRSPGTPLADAQPHLTSPSPWRARCAVAFLQLRTPKNATRDSTPTRLPLAGPRTRPSSPRPARSETPAWTAPAGSCRARCAVAFSTRADTGWCHTRFCATQRADSQLAGGQSVAWDPSDRSAAIPNLT